MKTILSSTRLLSAFMIFFLGLTSGAEARKWNPTYLKPLIRVTAESEPGKVSTIGIRITEQKEIVSFYTQLPSGAIVEYNVDQLTDYQVLIRHSGYDLVHVKALDRKGKSLLVSIRYVRNVMDKRTGSHRFFIQYNPNLDDYQIFDESGRPFTSAHVATHRNLVGMPVGIEEIHTQQ